MELGLRSAKFEEWAAFLEEGEPLHERALKKLQKHAQVSFWESGASKDDSNTRLGVAATVAPWGKASNAPVEFLFLRSEFAAARGLPVVPNSAEDNPIRAARPLHHEVDTTVDVAQPWECLLEAIRETFGSGQMPVAFSRDEITALLCELYERGEFDRAECGEFVRSCVPE